MRQRTKLSQLFTVSALASGLLLAGCGDGKDGKDGVAGNAGPAVVASTTSGFMVLLTRGFMLVSQKTSWFEITLPRIMWRGSK